MFWTVLKFAVSKQEKKSRITLELKLKATITWAHKCHLAANIFESGPMLAP